MLKKQIIISLWEKGYTNRAIHETTKIPKSTIRHVLSEAGVKGNKTIGRDVQTVLELYKQNYTHSQICAITGFGYNRVHQAIQRHC